MFESFSTNWLILSLVEYRPSATANPVADKMICGRWKNLRPHSDRKMRSLKVGLQKIFATEKLYGRNYIRPDMSVTVRFLFSDRKCGCNPVANIL